MSRHACPGLCFGQCRRIFVLSLTILAMATLSVASFADELPTASPGDVDMSAEKLKAVDTAMQEMIKAKRIAGGIVMVARNGKICLFNAYGQRNVDANLPMQKDTIVRIYSMTKAIATAAAMTLVDEGKLSVDDPVAKYVPELKDVRVHNGKELVKPKRAMTVADLMRHTAGYTYGDGNAAIKAAYREHSPLGASDLDDMAKRLANVPLAFQPGDDWIYGISIDVLGLVIERASGEKLDTFLKKRIFKPLNMKDTGFYCPKKKHDRFASLYRLNNGNLERYDQAGSGRSFDKPRTFLSAGGGLVSTARDYMHFLMMIRNGGELFGRRILKAETVKQMTSNQLSDKAFPIGFGSQVRDGIGFGFGFAVCVNKSKFDAARPVGEFGWGGAASTHFWVSPKDDLIVITLEQRMPYSFETEFKLKPMIYGAIEHR